MFYLYFFLFCVFCWLLLFSFVFVYLWSNILVNITVVFLVLKIFSRRCLSVWLDGWLAGWMVWLILSKKKKKFATLIDSNIYVDDSWQANINFKCCVWCWFEWMNLFVSRKWSELKLLVFVGNGLFGCCYDDTNTWISPLKIHDMNQPTSIHCKIIFIYCESLIDKYWNH